ncbi:Sec-independent protein translocase protein TatB [Pandoraea sp.]|uniref:Sec-independent protein translocase protein TatB n=1 Tax=Pandoraea sp. TaxID=1883445 RepID=UPI0011F66B99|nr:Sec-independent protein translocase protein TatB [Pandoraea sp.]TAL53783.1 MAG: Sec-independent protein translocase subunit TatB [Pandoraea sp.]TAM17036.1 MAG: Sec-independent protein translocase subunit TatB [Pandoraea sp.]
MFDFDLSKMMLIGIVALVVIGPERLPKVARTAGALFGRAQRYINDVKAEVSREIELDGLRSMRAEFEDAARQTEAAIRKNLKEQETALNEAWQGAVAGDDATAGTTDGMIESRIGSSLRTTTKRRNWRVRQSATPVWFKKASLKRTQVQSAAARVARHTPARMRRPARFF